MDDGEVSSKRTDSIENTQRNFHNFLCAQQLTVAKHSMTDKSYCGWLGDGFVMVLVDYTDFAG